MSFPIEHDASFSPQDIEVMRSIYAAISAEPWFVKDERRHEDFAGKVLLMYRRGVVIPDKLHEICLLLARKHFSEPLDPSGN